MSKSHDTFSGNVIVSAVCRNITWTHRRQFSLQVKKTRQLFFEFSQRIKIKRANRNKTEPTLVEKGKLLLLPSLPFLISLSAAGEAVKFK